MASINKYAIDGYECCKVVDTSSGRRLQYAIKLDRFTAKQWLAAHNEVMRSLSPEDRHGMESKRLKEIVIAWLQTPKEGKASAKQTGIKIQAIESKSEATIKKVVDKYLLDFCNKEINSPNAISKAQRQCQMLMLFFEQFKIFQYSRLKREAIKKYPEWRSKKGGAKAAADTVNQELRRLGSVIKHGVKFCGWQERYLLDGVKVKATPENTKAVKPFELGEAKIIMGWLWNYSEQIGSWYLHDMALLALCSGLEAKALTLLKPDWFKIDLGILRVFDKLVSGVIDAKTQNRARDIPLTPTMRKIFERGCIFKRPHKTQIKDYSRRAFARLEKETSIDDVNWHRFRHTCATARLSAGWQLVRVSRMLGHSSVNTTASHYAEYDLSASPAGFEGMLKVYGDFVRWLDEGYFSDDISFLPSCQKNPHPPKVSTPSPSAPQEKAQSHGKATESPAKTPANAQKHPKKPRIPGRPTRLGGLANSPAKRKKSEYGHTERMAKGYSQAHAVNLLYV